ncbi:MAG: hypothetical protein GEU94_13535 [Micromonosporaceae bacterium]|nr:hypothetical protein [Micromonosporaceae bacterium]
MSAYHSKEQALSVFTELFEILLADELFVARMRAGGLSLRLVQTDPALQLHVGPSGVRECDESASAAISIKMSCDTAHQLWSGSLLMPLALATGKIRIRGSVSKVLEFVPLLRPAFDRYPTLAETAGVRA